LSCASSPSVYGANQRTPLWTSDRVGPNPTFIYAGMFPKLAGDFDWVDTGLLPPCSLVARAMNRAVMHPA